MVSPRIRRLRTDLKMLQKLRSESTIFTFDAPPMHADAPDSYVLRFRGAGLAKNDASQIIRQEHHEVFIKLGANYPRGTPELAWKTPIFQPNISAGGAVCLGGYGTHWTPSLMLDELCTMLWDMIRFANFDVESPYNREAAHWAKTQSQYSLPLDSRHIRDRVATNSVDSKPTAGRPPIQGLPVAPAPSPAVSGDELVFLNEEVIEAEVVEPATASSPTPANEDSGITFLD